MLLDFLSDLWLKFETHMFLQWSPYLHWCRCDAKARNSWRMCAPWTCWRPTEILSKKPRQAPFFFQSMQQIVKWSRQAEKKEYFFSLRCDDTSDTVEDQASRFSFSGDSLSCTAFGNHILIHLSKTQDLAAGSEEFWSAEDLVRVFREGHTVWKRDKGLLGFQHSSFDLLTTVYMVSKHQVFCICR